MSGRASALALALALAALAFLVVARWPSQAASRPAANGRLVVTEQVIDRLEAEHGKLHGEVAVLRSDADARQQRAADAGSLHTALDEQRALAGILPLQGRGIDLLLDDSDASAVPPSEDPSNYLVHDDQLRDVANLLWGAGAAGIAINGERVVSSTSIYCVGSTILIDDTRTSPPYHLVAIGDPDRMRAALDDGRSLRDLKARAAVYGLVVKVGRVGTFTLPGFAGRIAIAHAAIVPVQPP